MARLSDCAPTPDEKMVKDANRKLFDAVAEQYERIDGRRSPVLEEWLRERLREIRSGTPGGVLLDIGAGSGLVTRCAEGIFETRLACDISPRILAAGRSNFDLAVAADVDRLPLAESTVHAITAFAVLHHLYGFEALVEETARVLAPGGVFYSDHDMDALFYRRFKPLLNLYRFMHDAAGRYKEASPCLDDELFHLSEWGEEGLDGPAIATAFEKAGFEVRTCYHWFGLNGLCDRLFGKRPRRRGWAPLLTILARKKA